MINIYTDGACRGNQNTFNMGGWGFVLTDKATGKARHCWGHEANTTNNRMEMTAAIKALHAIRNRSRSEVTVYSDSNLMVKGMTEWLSGWKAKGWKNSGKKPVENKDLWVQLEELSALHNVTWQHVKGHNGNAGNELADQLANRGADGQQGKQDFVGGM
ncbi:ribonuclease HI [Amphritea atlantica]|uniref:ribonuclease H n=1 Tax=Amphritea atlantica TaxID=355243 RepID=A0ABY5GWX8_9GAMM|nr:ribonuclease HI [Amphritea atlantica]